MKVTYKTEVIVLGGGIIGTSIASAHTRIYNFAPMNVLMEGLVGPLFKNS